MKLLEADGTLSLFYSDPDEWARDKKRLNRANASWVRTGPLDQPAAVFCSTPCCGEPFTDREAAVRRLGAELRKLAPVRAVGQKRCRPIHCSKSWKLPRKPRLYELVGGINTRDVELVRERLTRLGIPSCVRRTAGSKVWDVVFYVPPGKEQLVKERLAGL